MPPETPNRIGLGIACRLAAVVAFAGMSAAVKATAEAGVPVMEIVFFRSLFALAPILGFAWFSGGLSVLKTARPGAHFLRSGMGVFSMICGFAALGLLPLSDAAAIGFSAPLFITALSAVVLREPVGVRRWGAVLVGFLGVLVMLRPQGASGLGASGLGAALALLSALGSAGAMTAIRKMGRSEPGATIAFYFTLAGIAAGGVTLPWVWQTPDGATLSLLALTGLLGGIGQIFLTQAFRMAPAAVVAPFDYTQLIWASLLGWLLWSETPAAGTLVGGAIVAATGVYIVLRERQLGRDRDVRSAT